MGARGQEATNVYLGGVDEEPRWCTIGSSRGEERTRKPVGRIQFVDGQCRKADVQRDDVPEVLGRPPPRIPSCHGCSPERYKRIPDTHGRSSETKDARGGQVSVE